MMTLEGQAAVVTGGGRGIGRAIARRLVQAGASVAVLDADPDAARETADDIEREGGRSLVLAADVSQRQEVQRAVDQAAAHFGRLDILVNNAAIRHIAPLMDHTLEAWDRTLAVNLTGPFLMTRAVIPHMLRRGAGKIVNVASIAGLTGRSHRAAYCAAKGGLISFTEAAAADMAGTNICINALAPGLIDSPMNGAYAADDHLGPARAQETLLRRWGRPEEVAEAALFLASPASDFITGTVLRVDGGWLSFKDRFGETDPP